jgi:hypothetical protein
LSDAIAAFDRKVEAIVGVAAAGGGRGRGAGGGAGGGGRAGGPERAEDAEETPAETLASAGAALSGVMNILQGADVRPTTVQLSAIAAARARLDA